MAGELTGWLRGLGRDGLAAVLAQRPDACVSPAPTSIGELAARLASRPSVELALQSLDAGTLQLTEVLAGLDRPTRAELGRFVGEGGGDESLDAALERLRGRALVWDEPGADGPTRLRSAGALAGLWGHPMGLGSPMRPLLGRLQPDVLESIVTTLDLRAAPTRSATHGIVVAHLTPDRIRRLAEDAPDDVAALLSLCVDEGPQVRLPIAQAMGLHGLARQPDRGVVWAARRGLLLPSGWDVVEMPREVGLALRGDDWRAPLDLAPPPLRTTACDASAVAREGGARANELTDLVAAVVESVAAQPLVPLKTGGVGVREVRRLAKAMRHSETDVVLALELAGAASLLRVEVRNVLATETYDGWRVAAPVDRLLPLLQAWWSHPAGITERTDPASGKPRPPLAWVHEREDVRRLRQAVVSFLASLPEGRALTDLDAVVRHVGWSSPLRYPSRAVDLAEQAAAIWHEAQALGLLASGATTPVGAALSSGDPDALRSAATDAMPAVTETALFQADLTAVVTGTPGGALAELLDSAADREARGNASTWRFSPESIRVFLDAGGSAEHLAKELQAIAAKGVPQPLAYLIRDVARRHGHVSVRPVSCVVVSPDEALLAEIAGTKSLGSLKPVLLAPTVLASSRPVAETLELLRAAGYVPTRLTDSGEVSVERATAPRAVADLDARRRGRSTGRSAPVVRPARRPATPPVEPAALAATLLLAPDDQPEPAKPVSLTAARVRELGPHLEQHEVAVLAHAIDHGGAVLISYVDVNGRGTERVISDVTLFPPFIEAWCHLRNDERMFSISGIGSVSPA